MRILRLLVIIAMSFALVAAPVWRAGAEPSKHDLSSAGLPYITGNLGGSVVGSQSVLSDLYVVVDFGEVSPANTSQIIKVIVPVAIRSTTQYQVTLSVTGTYGASANAVKASDIGIGIQNFRALGPRATSCSAYSTINPVFANDPAASVTINPSTGRAQFPASLASIGTSTVLISGPVLSIFQGVGNWRRDPDNGRAFDLVLAIKPQWFEPGSFSITLRLSMSEGPLSPCS